MEQLQVTWWRATKIWWSMVWRSIGIVLLTSIPAGLFIGIIIPLMGGTQQQVMLISNVVSTLIGIPVGIWVVKMVLEMQFTDFRTVLFPSLESMLDTMPAGNPDRDSTPD